MTINYLAILVAAIAAWVFGAVWYGVLGKLWREALFATRAKNPHEGKPGLPIGPMIISFVAELLMAFMLAGLMVHLGGPSLKAGLISAPLIWLGFVAPTLITNQAYQGERRLMTLIDLGHWLGVVLILGVVIGLFG